MSSNATKGHVYALFANREQAIAAYDTVQQRGCKNEHCSVLLQRDVLDPEELELGETAAREGAKKGALVVGATSALLAGLIALPGGLLGLGPIAATLLGGAWGAGFGGMLGAIIGASEATRTVRAIEDELSAGKILVAVETDDPELAQMCTEEFAAHGGIQLQS